MQVEQQAYPVITTRGEKSAVWRPRNTAYTAIMCLDLRQKCHPESGFEMGKFQRVVPYNALVVTDSQMLYGDFHGGRYGGFLSSCCSFECNTRYRFTIPRGT
jgi:hypothetical protein